MKPQDVDVLLRIMQIADAPQNLDAMQYVIFQFDFKDYEQFILECPPGSIRFNNFLRVAVFCDNLGVLVDGGGVDPETVFELYPIPWTKMEPIVMGMRRELAWPDLFDYFEKLGKQYQKWWEPKAKKIKLPEAPKAEARPCAGGSSRRMRSRRPPAAICRLGRRGFAISNLSCNPPSARRPRSKGICTVAGSPIPKSCGPCRRTWRLSAASDSGLRKRCSH